MGRQKLPSVVEFYRGPRLVWNNTGIYPISGRVFNWAVYLATFVTQPLSGLFPTKPV